MPASEPAAGVPSGGPMAKRFHREEADIRKTTIFARKPTIFASRDPVSGSLELTSDLCQAVATRGYECPYYGLLGLGGALGP